MSFLSGALNDAKELLQTLEKARILQTEITKGLQEMSAKGQELKDLITGIGTDVTEIDGDLDEVLEKVNAINELPTAEEWTEIKSMLSGVKDKTAAVAAKVPEPAEPPTE